MTVSIVIPVYKEEIYLARTLKALTLQTAIRDCEIILSEYNPDNSPYTMDLVQEFKQKFNVPINHILVDEPGIAYARNQGVLQAKGEFFVNFDADARFNKRDSLEKMIVPLKGSTKLTICDNEFDYRDLSEEELKDMIMPQQILDGLNNAQTIGYPILEPGSCFNIDSFVEVGGFNNAPKWELSLLAPRFIFKFPGKIKYVLGVSVIVSPRRALKLRELGIGAINYAQAVRGNKVVKV